MQYAAVFKGSKNDNFYIKTIDMSRVMRKPSFWFPTWSDTNQAVQLQKMARDLKFQIWEVEGLYYLCSENKGVDQLRRYLKAYLLLCLSHMQKRWFSHDAAQLCFFFLLKT